MIGDLDWKLAWQGIGTLRPKTLDISTWDKGPDRIKKVFSIFDSSLCENNTDMEYMKRTLAQVTLKVKWLLFLTCLILQLTFRTRNSVHRSLAQNSWLYSMWVERSSGLKWTILESFRGVESIFEIFVIVFCSKVTSGKDCFCLFDGRDLEILWWFCRGRYTSGSQTALLYLLQRLKWCTFWFWIIL